MRQTILPSVKQSDCETRTCNIVQQQPQPAGVAPLRAGGPRPIHRIRGIGRLKFAISHRRRRNYDGGEVLQ